MDTLLVAYTPSERSIRAAVVFGNYFWKTLLWMALVFGGLMAVVDVPSVDWRSTRAVLGWALLHLAQGLGYGLGMALLFRYVLLPWQARNLFRKNPAMYGPSSLRISDEGLTFVAPNSTATFGWSDLRGFADGKDALVIATTGSMRFAVPREGTALSDLEALRRLLNGRLPVLKR